ncbi:Rieske 2Fe-2S domain-containing protein [Paraburkholderia fungorum]|uniref:Rieske 2Fe-2S domain-containing protein n=1 Tax=Paraburkholderia fungorum TaxID=134537 RepID=UPI0038BB3704
MGDLFRRFWQAVALSRELPENDGPPIWVQVLGEHLVAFRDTGGRVGLVEPHCPHRGADLFYAATSSVACVVCSMAGNSTSMAVRSIFRTFRQTRLTTRK